MRIHGYRLVGDNLLLDCELRMGPLPFIPAGGYDSFFLSPSNSPPLTPRPVAERIHAECNPAPLLSIIDSASEHIKTWQ